MSDEPMTGPGEGGMVIKGLERTGQRTFVDLCGGRRHGDEIKVIYTRNHKGIALASCGAKWKRGGNLVLDRPIR